VPNGRTDIFEIQTAKLLEALIAANGEGTVAELFEVDPPADLGVTLEGLRDRVRHHGAETTTIEEHHWNEYIVQVGRRPSGWVCINTKSPVFPYVRRLHIGARAGLQATADGTRANRSDPRTMSWIRHFLRRRWFRAWIVSASVVLASALASSLYYVWGSDACYRYVSISSNERGISPTDRDLVADLRKQASARTFCGETRFSAILTMEALAKRGAVWQIGFQWREPTGWSFDDLDTLDVLEANEIQHSILVSRVAAYVQTARLRRIIPWALAAVGLSVGAFVLGLGVAWIRRGAIRID
jgi:hypothetical protein